MRPAFHITGYKRVMRPTFHITTGYTHVAVDYLHSVPQYVHKNYTINKKHNSSCTA
jgi:hypothetical protein